MELLLLEARKARTPLEIELAVNDIEAMGLRALPHVILLVRRLHEGNLALPALEALARRLSLIVAEVVLGEDVARTMPELMEYLRALEGHPLTPEDLAALVIRAAKSLPEDAGALYLDATPPRRYVIPVCFPAHPGSHEMPTTTVVHVLVEDGAH